MKHFIKENYKYLLSMFLFIVLFSIMNFILFGDNCDQIWEFGFAHNILHGMLPYKDFNMVTLPMHSWINAIVLKIFGDKYFVYMLFHNLLLATIPTYTFYKSHNFVKAIVVFLLLIPCCWATYNAMLLFNVFLLLYLENNHKNNDYLIGILLAFSVLIKQSIGVFLLLPSLFLKDKRKIKKRGTGFFIIMLFFLIYLLVTNSFYECINYTVFGLFDFASKNGNGLNGFTILYLLILIGLIYKYIKTKNLDILYLIAFSTVVIPLFDFTHFFLMIVPIIIWLIINDKIKLINNIYLSLFLLLIICGYCTLIYKTYVNDNYVETDKNNIFYLSVIKTPQYDVLNKEINNLIKKNKDTKVYLLLDTAYLFHLDNNRKIDTYSLTLYGNNGYNGTKKLENNFDNMDSGTIFIIDNTKNNQSNQKLREYIKKKSNKIGDISNVFAIYQKK